MIISLILNGWYVEHNGRCGVYYYELEFLKIRRIFIDGEILMGIPGFVLFIPNINDWKNNQPAWASDRRDEIIDRIKTKFNEPEYLYDFKL